MDANSLAMDKLLKSPQEISEERGRDWREIAEEIAEAQEIAKELGLEFQITTPAPTPGVIENEEGEEVNAS